MVGHVDVQVSVLAVDPRSTHEDRELVGQVVDIDGVTHRDRLVGRHRHCHRQEHVRVGADRAVVAVRHQAFAERGRAAGPVGDVAKLDSRLGKDDTIGIAI